MAKRKFKTDLSVKGIQNLKDELLNYKNNVLQQKLNLLVEELARIGLAVSKVKISESPLGKYVSVRIDTELLRGKSKAILLAVGAVKESEGYEPFNTLLAIEFGAGIHYNPTPNPNADKLGLGVGTFPGQIHAFEDGWYYWDDNEEKWRYTHGVKATMPMYYADMEIIQSVMKTAKDVFKK